MNKVLILTIGVLAMLLLVIAIVIVAIFALPDLLEAIKDAKKAWGDLKGRKKVE